MLSKFGRKVCCNFNENIKCILLIDGNKLCVFDETTEEQIENGDFQIGICPLLPKSMRDEFVDSMKRDGFSVFKAFRG